MKITSRMPRDEYDAIDALNISRLKNLKRSPLHYRHFRACPHTSDAMTLGTATHVATLEPERFTTDFAVWRNRTESGKMSPRSGKNWEAFALAHASTTIITADEEFEAKAIAEAVRSDARAMLYLASGDPEVTMEWTLPPELQSRPAKGRADWLTSIDGDPFVVGLKTARDCRHFSFGSQAARLEYAMQWAYYFDGYLAITGREPQLREIVVESTAPYAVAVYRITEDIVLQGRENYWELVKQLADCETRDEWPGPEPLETELTLPSWYYGTQDDDISTLGLEA